MAFIDRCMDQPWSRGDMHLLIGASTSRGLEKTWHVLIGARTSRGLEETWHVLIGAKTSRGLEET